MQAIHLSRPDPDVEDLIMTGQKILESFARKELDTRFLDEKMSEIARAYFEYYRDQRIPNFHGLRDFCEFSMSNSSNSAMHSSTLIFIYLYEVANWVDQN